MPRFRPSGCAKIVDRLNGERRHNAACHVNHNFQICRRFAKHPSGGTVTRPRAAADFPMIRTRMEELRRERALASAGADQSQSIVGPRPYAISIRPALAGKPHLLPAIRRA